MRNLEIAFIFNQIADLLEIKLLEAALKQIRART